MEQSSLVVLRHEAGRYYLVPSGALEQVRLSEKARAAFEELLELDDVRAHIIAPDHGDASLQTAVQALGVLPPELAAKLPDDLLASLAEAADAVGEVGEGDSDALVMLDPERQYYLLSQPALDRFELSKGQRAALDELLALDDVRVHIISPEATHDELHGLPFEVLGTLPAELRGKLSGA